MSDQRRQASRPGSAKPGAARPGGRPKPAKSASGRGPASGRDAARRKKTSGLRAQLRRRPLPLWIVIVADVLVFAVALNVFALFHHVLPRREEAVGIRSQRGGAAPSAEVLSAVSAEGAQGEAENLPPAQGDGASESAAGSSPGASESAPQAEQTPAPEIDPEGIFAIKFADKFTSGEVERTKEGYRSENINMTLTPYEVNGVDFYVMDFYLKDISSFQTGFANDKFARGQYEKPSKTLERMDAIAGINGDYYGGRTDGIVLRNGMLYRNGGGKRLKRDLCVLYWNGTMETCGPKDFDVDAAVTKGAYQIWNFGPMLLDEDGQVMTEFNSDVNPENPRTAIGYFEPGHYCFVTVDGRSKKSEGVTLRDLSKLMFNLGCARAYNLDGGETSVMIYGGETVNVPAGGGRKSTDVVGIVEP